MKKGKVGRVSHLFLQPSCKLGQSFVRGFSHKAFRLVSFFSLRDVMKCLSQQMAEENRIRKKQPRHFNAHREPRESLHAPCASEVALDIDLTIVIELSQQMWVWKVMRAATVSKIPCRWDSFIPEHSFPGHLQGTGDKKINTKYSPPPGNSQPR